MTDLSLTEWLVDTAIWTAILIALVLMIRRPVKRYLGAKVAYALWAIPAIRLILPPVVLPASMAPAEASPDPFLIPSIAADPAVISSPPPALTDPTQSLAPSPFWEPLLSATWLTEAAIAIWLVGAAVFLGIRFSGYFRMREELLSDAKEMGRVGKVRLVETPAASAPLAFGVFDKVVALPEEFLSLPDKEMRDLAIAHELAHHRGKDLLINMLMQPLFALHWFNPLGYYGWLALRRDQESACDARVLEESTRDKRITYARTIASFAAGPNVALAAPMACPVLGEKSIIERLRSLNMSNTSPRRAMAGKLTLLGALVALPLTASVTYAESQSVEEAFADVAPVAPEPPTPPAPPVAPDAPLAPEPPEAPEAPEAPTSHDVDHRVHVFKHSQSHDGEGHDGHRIEKIRILKGGEHLTAEERREIEVELREAMAEREHAMAEVKEAMKEVRIELREVMKDLQDGRHEALMELESSGQGRTVVEMKCAGEDVATSKTLDDGTNVVMLCQSKVMAQALKGLREARAEIAGSAELDKEMKSEVLRTLDEEIRKWEKELADA